MENGMEDFWYGMKMEWKKIASMEYGKIVFHSISYHALMWNYNSTDLWWRPCFSILLGVQPHLDQKPTNFTAKTIFFLVFIFFWTEKGWHRAIPHRVPPSLATPL